MTDEELLDLARQVRDKAHCPYSGFSVGAALIDENGNTHVGCNVENAAYSNVSCAEAGAISAMVSAGGTRIVRIAVAGGDKSDKSRACTPCGGAKGGSRRRVRLPAPVLSAHGAASCPPREESTSAFSENLEALGRRAAQELPVRPSGGPPLPGRARGFSCNPRTDGSRSPLP